MKRTRHYRLQIMLSVMERKAIDTGGFKSACPAELQRFAN